MEKCPQCGGEEVMQKKFSDNGFNLYEFYCPVCSFFEEEWGGMSDSYALQMIRTVEQFDKMIALRRKILPEKMHERLLLKMKATLVQQENTKKAPQIFKHIFWILTNVNNVYSMDQLQKEILSYLYFDEEWNDPNQQYILAIDYEEKTALTLIEEQEKSFKHCYLAIGIDSNIVMDRENFNKEINFAGNKRLKN